MLFAADPLGATWRLGGVGEGSTFGVGLASWCISEAQVWASLWVNEVEEVGVVAGVSMAVGAIGGFAAIVGEGVPVDAAEGFGVEEASMPIVGVGEGMGVARIILVAVAVAE